jgi:O-methyltransferase
MTKNWLLRIYNKVFKTQKSELNLNYSNDGLFTVHNADFMYNTAFKVAYTAAKATNSWGDANIEWRVHVGLWVALQAARLEGDFVECGTNRGGMATAILTYLAGNNNFQKKKFYCFDTFQGLSEKYSTAEEYQHMVGQYSDCFSEVKTHFDQFPQVTLIKGVVPETLSQFNPAKIAFLHIDMNSAIPEIAAAEFFWPQLVSGAYMLLDDFAWEACKNQRDTFIEFAKQNKVEILWLPTGQGLIQKP